MKHTIVYHGKCCEKLKLPHTPSEASVVSGFKQAVYMADMLANRFDKTMYIQKNNKTMAVVSPRAILFSKFTDDGYVMIPLSKYITK